MRIVERGQGGKGVGALMEKADLVNRLGSTSDNAQIAQPRLGLLGLWPKRLL